MSLDRGVRVPPGRRHLLKRGRIAEGSAEELGSRRCCVVEEGVVVAVRGANWGGEARKERRELWGRAMWRAASVGANGGERSARGDHLGVHGGGGDGGGGGCGGPRLLRWRHLLQQQQQQRDEQGARGCCARGGALSDASLAISDEQQARWRDTVVGCERSTLQPPRMCVPCLENEKKFGGERAMQATEFKITPAEMTPNPRPNCIK